MARLPAHLEVKRSLIPDAGMGLFARRKIKKGKSFGRYRGRLFSAEAADLLPGDHKPYLMFNIEGQVLDGSREDNHMRWANHSTRPNAFADLESDGVIFFKARRDIKAGEEIYIDYGYDPTVPDAPPDLSRCKNLTYI